MKSWPASKVVSMRVESLVPYARNARTHSDQQVAQIAASIKEWGWTNPVLVDDSNGVIAGHGRILAAQKIGLEQVPVMVAEGWTDQQKRAYVIADNKLALNADWDYDVLPLELSELKDMGADLNLIGFDDAELDSILNQDGVTDGLTDPDETPDIEDDAVSKEGDIWVMGKHRLMCGDTADNHAIDQLLSGRDIDLIVTSPPYNQKIDSFSPSGMHSEGNWVAKVSRLAYADDLPERDYQSQQDVLLNLWFGRMRECASIFYTTRTDIEISELYHH